MKDIELIIENVVATQAMSGIEITEDIKQLMRDCMTGKKDFEKVKEEEIKKLKDIFQK